MTTYGTLELDPVREVAFQERLTRLREQWVEQVTTLVREAEEWAMAAKDARHWAVERRTHEIAEEVVGGAYSIPGICIVAGDDELRLEPVARGVLHADGRVDLYAWPSMYRVMLLRKNGQWVIRTESGLDWPQAWGRETFLTLADGLLRAEWATFMSSSSPPSLKSIWRCIRPSRRTARSANSLEIRMMLAPDSSRLTVKYGILLTMG